MKYVWFMLLAACAALPALAETGTIFPHFASFKSNEVFMREGPSKEHRVKWVYHRKGLPVEVLAQFDVWQHVRTQDGEEGWVHNAMLSNDRTVSVTGDAKVELMSSSSGGSPVATVEPGAIGRLQTCDTMSCELKFGDTEGWLPRARLWGVYAAEKFD